MTTLKHFAENVEEASEFYTFDSERKRDNFVRRHIDESWKLGRIVLRDGVEQEITDCYI